MASLTHKTAAIAITAGLSLTSVPNQANATSLFSPHTGFQNTYAAQAVKIANCAIDEFRALYQTQNKVSTKIRKKNPEQNAQKKPKKPQNACAFMPHLDGFKIQ